MVGLVSWSGGVGQVGILAPAVFQVPAVERLSQTCPRPRATTDASDWEIPVYPLDTIFPSPDFAGNRIRHRGDHHELVGGGNVSTVSTPSCGPVPVAAGAGDPGRADYFDDRGPDATRMPSLGEPV